MAKSELVKARWIGGFRAFLPDGTILEHGETVVDVPRGEAEASTNWDLVGGKPATERAGDTGEEA